MVDLVETVDLVGVVGMVEKVDLEEKVENDISTKDPKTYKVVADRIAEWLVLHYGERFNLDTICRQCNIMESKSRNYASIELSKRVKKLLLEKEVETGIYTSVNTKVKSIDWINASENDTINLCWPSGRKDGTIFGFAPYAVTSPGDVVVIAGGSNFGKTTFALNFLWDNMDSYNCTLMGNEYSPAKFKRRIANMTWANPLNAEGKPKFELIERRERWQDIIRPDNINIIDWINLGDNFYQIGKIIESIQSKLHNGIAVIVLQKADGKELGLGGSFSEHLASLYFTINYQRLTVVKCKEFTGGFNPNKHVYGFDIVDSGTKFHNIREVQKCSYCAGKGNVFNKGICDFCSGTGWVDKHD